MIMSKLDTLQKGLMVKFMKSFINKQGNIMQ